MVDYNGIVRQCCLCGYKTKVFYMWMELVNIFVPFIRIDLYPFGTFRYHTFHTCVLYHKHIRKIYYSMEVYLCKSLINRNQVSEATKQNSIHFKAASSVNPFDILKQVDNSFAPSFQPLIIIYPWILFFYLKQGGNILEYAIFCYQVIIEYEMHTFHSILEYRCFRVDISRLVQLLA